MKAWQAGLWLVIGGGPGSAAWGQEAPTSPKCTPIVAWTDLVSEEAALKADCVALPAASTDTFIFMRSSQADSPFATVTSATASDNEAVLQTEELQRLREALQEGEVFVSAFKQGPKGQAPASSTLRYPTPSLAAASPPKIQVATRPAGDADLSFSGVTLTATFTSTGRHLQVEPVHIGGARTWTFTLPKAGLGGEVSLNASGHPACKRAVAPSSDPFSTHIDRTDADQCSWVFGLQGDLTVTYQESAPKSSGDDAPKAPSPQKYYVSIEAAQPTGGAPNAINRGAPIVLAGEGISDSWLFAFHTGGEWFLGKAKTVGKTRQLGAVTESGRVALDAWRNSAAKPEHGLVVYGSDHGDKASARPLRFDYVRKPAVNAAALADHRTWCQVELLDQDPLTAAVLDAKKKLDLDRLRKLSDRILHGDGSKTCWQAWWQPSGRVPGAVTDADQGHAADCRRYLDLAQELDFPLDKNHDVALWKRSQNLRIPVAAEQLHTTNADIRQAVRRPKLYHRPATPWLSDGQVFGRRDWYLMCVDATDGTMTQYLDDASLLVRTNQSVAVVVRHNGDQPIKIETSGEDQVFQEHTLYNPVEEGTSEQQSASKKDEGDKKPEEAEKKTAEGSTSKAASASTAAGASTTMNIACSSGCCSSDCDLDEDEVKAAIQGAKAAQKAAEEKAAAAQKAQKAAEEQAAAAKKHADSAKAHYERLFAMDEKPRITSRYLLPRRGGSVMSVTVSNATSDKHDASSKVTTQLYVKKTYAAAIRLGVALSLTTENDLYEVQTFDGVTPEITVQRPDLIPGREGGPAGNYEVVLGFVPFGRHGRDYIHPRPQSVPPNARWGPYLGLGLVGTDGSQTKFLSSTYIGGEWEFARSSSIAFAITGRRVQKLDRGFTVGMAAPSDDPKDFTHNSVAFGAGLVLNVSPDFLRLAARNSVLPPLPKADTGGGDKKQEPKNEEAKEEPKKDDASAGKTTTTTTTTVTQ